MIDLDELERRAKAATPMGGGDIARLLDACSPETILALVRVARAAKTWRQRLIDRPAASRDVIVGLADELVEAVDALGTPPPFCAHCGAHRNNLHDGCCPLNEDDQP